MTGGGTLGPVTPLLAIVEAWRRRDPDVRVSWVGTPSGPERDLIKQVGVEFNALTAPKLHRHRKWMWPLAPLLLIWSCMHAVILLKKLQPDIVFTAGGYVSVPVVWMAFFMRIPSWVHQLDVEPGLANQLMAPFARRVSVTWKKSAKAFSKRKTIVVGGLVRTRILSGRSEHMMDTYHLRRDKPTVLVLGGGTGAQSLNEAVQIIASDIVPKMNVILLTGRGKLSEQLRALDLDGFIALEFLDEDMADAYAAADVVVARAGMGTISELVALRKPTILVPIRGSHQEKNAKALEDRNAAHVVWKLTPQVLEQAILHLVQDDQRRQGLRQRIGQVFRLDAADRIVKRALDIIKK